MTPEEIRRLYRQEQEPTEAEARATFEEVRSDPEAARRLLSILYALSSEDRSFAMMKHLFEQGMLMRLITERAENDDAYALECGQLITDLMKATMRPPRGKPKTAKTA